MTDNEEQRLYEARLAASNDCVAPLPAQIPDAAPQPSLSPCDTPHTLVDTFTTPPGAPEEPAAPDTLPGGINVYNLPATTGCSAGTLYPGYTPENLSDGYTFDAYTATISVEAGAEFVTVYFDDIRTGGLPLFRDSELYRLQGRMADIVAFVDAELPLVGEDTSAFETGLASVMRVSAADAVIVTAYLLAARDTADAIAAAQISSYLFCGFSSAEFWIRCAGGSYEIAASDPGPGWAHVPAGASFSTTSQADADTAAQANAASSLNCRYGNTTQTAKCKDYAVAWLPEGSIINANGSSFWVIGGKDGEGRDIATQRTLVSSHTVSANTYFAPTQEAANALALAAAASELDCFVPSPPVTLSCADINTSTADRAAVIGKSGALNEMATGHRSISRATRKPDNQGFYTGGHIVNMTPTLQTVLPVGMFASSTPENAQALAEAHARSLLDCVWESPEYKCGCVGLADELNNTLSPPVVVKDYQVLTSQLSTEKNTRLNYAESTASGAIPRGQFSTSTFPAADINAADPWRDTLSVICFATLECVYESCAIACCAPLEDDRPFMENGEVNRFNYNQTGSNVISNAASRTAWKAGRLLPVGCSGVPDGCSENPTAPGCEGYTPGCEGSSRSVFGNWDATAPVRGTPAKFRFGGTLAYGAVWSDGSNARPCGDAAVTQEGVEGLDHYSCAIGKARNIGAFTGLHSQALKDATSRLNCDHVNWPRVLTRCKSKSEKPLLSGFTIPGQIVASSTKLANAEAEKAVLMTMQCEETPPFKLAAVGGSMRMAAGSLFGGGGGGLSCNPETADKGLRPLKLYLSCTEEVPLNSNGFYDYELPGFKGHVFIEAKCCDNVVKWILHVENSTDNYADVQAAAGMSANAKSKMDDLSTSSNIITYVGSYAINDSDPGDGQERSYAVNQYLSAPIAFGTEGGGSTCAAFYKNYLKNAGEPTAKYVMVGGGVSGTLGGTILKGELTIHAGDTPPTSEVHVYLKVYGNGNAPDGWLQSGFTVTGADVVTGTVTDKVPTDSDTSGHIHVALGFWLDETFTALDCGNITVNYCNGFTVGRG